MGQGSRGVHNETVLVEVWSGSLSEFSFETLGSPLLKETSCFSMMSSVPGCNCTFIDNCPHLRDALVLGSFAGIQGDCRLKIIICLHVFIKISHSVR